MAKKIAINGFGRIGRLTLRNLLSNPEVEVVGINDLTDNATLAHLFKYDTTHGIYPGEVTSDETSIYINGKKIHATSIRDPKELPWAELDIDVVLECTGIFLTKEKASWHLEAGAKRVVLSAPAGEEVKTIVLGINGHEINDETKIYSNASCTTNCLAPVAKIIVDNWGIVSGSMSTVHAYTADQNLQDSPHKDLRRARAAAQNIVPTSTGAAKAAALVVPELIGKMTSMALRVPVITGSIVDLTIFTEKSLTREEVNETFKKASEGKFKGIIEYSELPLVSSDIIGNKYSAIFDSKLTLVRDNMLRIFAWYDNESGYSARLAELGAAVCQPAMASV
ncbi:MAG: type I glyceraldehyde-3-phosphate dehydrogenase [Saprospiraceae bacterium]|jgi:glyceraldehyde 3-phosphate dehydrogenase|nr:MAG: glyceraldehyde-3-phosphate dehydrogenase, type I [Candidatus Parvibacillus calidus]MBX2936457.1 type I glyceraldehyde-3-phosphate dehydrogenase [Saprospiraceae bacterium]MCB0592004.1 type I glyceraldehyde-3-phosphate dehydrogenase [Saprospiraceae bacterium]MCC7149335.1 type I glyceraldehyde-3-phosphate dehydrogenase [Saprospiraceae bacterium]MCO5283049.1 type I glyceraldehyde-3-phosphate dehydrogenase [Saprospiraceae bacterium]